MRRTDGPRHWRALVGRWLAVLGLVTLATCDARTPEARARDEAQAAARAAPRISAPPRTQADIDSAVTDSAPGERDMPTFVAGRYRLAFTYEDSIVPGAGESLELKSDGTMLGVNGAVEIDRLHCHVMLPSRSGRRAHRSCDGSWGPTDQDWRLPFQYHGDTLQLGGDCDEDRVYVLQRIAKDGRGSSP